jgi:hypothetical protein
MSNENCFYLYAFQYSFALITFGSRNNLVNYVVQTFMQIFVFRAAVDQFLFAESASLASAQALVRAITNHISLSAGGIRWGIHQSSIAEENRAFHVKIGWFFHAK